MTYDEVEAVLSQVLDREWDDLDPPSLNDWEKTERKLNCRFGDEFKYFFILISKYVLPGILNVSTGKNNGNDLITFVYDYEINNGNWNANMIPFFEIGNGDYFCINAKYGPASPVYYYSSEDFNVEEYNTSFEEWINNLPQFLNG
ncbi:MULTISPECIES: SMI1/KNR4 family protein [unclassified Lysinibacillus]|uniref:SMI1/KNR4 family protein n=1 Tax=unclassified Lysinibacillus TaxID=2636778 RepID=UPI0038155AC3